MTVETWSAVFAGGTFVVIAATAIAAIVQLRHLRAGNQLSMLITIMQMWNSSEMQEHIMFARETLPGKLGDPGFLAPFALRRLSRIEHPELLVADFFEQIGCYVKHGLMDESAWLDVASPQVTTCWDAIEPAIYKMREGFGDSAYENFEYLAVRARIWSKRHPHGAYPKGTPRMAVLKGANP